MLDLKFIRENPQQVKTGAERKKEKKCDVDLILELDEKRREIIREVEKLKSEKNQVSGEIAKKKKAGESAEDTILQMRRRTPGDRGKTERTTRLGTQYSP